MEINKKIKKKDLDLFPLHDYNKSSIEFSVFKITTKNLFEFRIPVFGDK